LSAVAAVAPARKAAFQILMAVERGHSHSDDLLRGRAVNALSPADRNLATALVLGVLRWQIRLDAEFRPLLKHPNARLDPEVLIAMRLGAFQLLHMDRIPARAAIDESVELVKQAGHRFASAMVNAVLRKLSGAPLRHSSEMSAAELAVSQAHPAWLVERWINHYGMESASEICHHGQTQPTQIIRVSSADLADELVAADIQLAPCELITAARRVISGDVASTTAFREGRTWFQDEGSQLVAEIGGQGTRILDCCAAPGGKTLILAERNPKAQIVACESSPPRHEQLRKRLTVHAARIECRLIDVTKLAEDSTYDVVLADVPCSGTGTLGRNPEIRHRLRVEDLSRQAARQREILTAALRAIQPGGRVVYSTCSLEPEENEAVIAAVLDQNANVRRVSFASRFDALLNEGAVNAGAAERLHRCITRDGDVRLLPGDFNTDGFFISTLERIDP
jgi:16S rRNA (cytosine967-C5)-methyltransferase